MDQLIFASLSHTHYWYEVGMLKVPACFLRNQTFIFYFLFSDFDFPNIVNTSPKTRVGVSVVIKFASSYFEKNKLDLEEEMQYV